MPLSQSAPFGKSALFWALRLGACKRSAWTGAGLRGTVDIGMRGCTRSIYSMHKREVLLFAAVYPVYTPPTHEQLRSSMLRRAAGAWQRAASPSDQLFHSHQGMSLYARS